jgi:hypothetical protein
MIFKAHIRKLKIVRVGKFKKTVTEDAVIPVEALDKTHCEKRIKDKYGQNVKLVSIL